MKIFLHREPSSTIYDPIVRIYNAKVPYYLVPHGLYQEEKRIDGENLEEVFLIFSFDTDEETLTATLEGFCSTEEEAQRVTSRMNRVGKESYWERKPIHKPEDVIYSPFYIPSS